jgi:hypothetical protein
MATIPPPDSFPESPPPDPGNSPGEVTPPTPDTDVPDPGDPAHPDTLEAEAHPS